MLIYDFTNRKNQTLYEFLYTSFKKDILNGRLIQGSKLPSKRSFAKDNQISVRTVMNAYEQLLAEGFIKAFLKTPSMPWKIRTIRKFAISMRTTPSSGNVLLWTMRELKLGI